MNTRFRTMTCGWFVLCGLAACTTSDPPTTPGPGGVFGEIELVDLTGDYAVGGPDTSRSTAFPFPADIDTFRALQLVVAGTWSVGTMEITNTFGFADTLDFRAGLSVQLTTAADPATVFAAVLNPPPLAFADWEEEFAACCPRTALDPRLLLEADLTATMSCDYSLPANARILRAPGGQVSAVKIVAVDAVPVAWPPGWSFP